ncbi:hypothetical protein U8C35_07680 [Sinorhizobium medicae]|uniref:hypothetical protein n=1 Tax=Sinorhizobium medicae TaxID=110321 RepID=UPI002AF6BD57|nr:hypothetical protein [Sinorhizobium medicae]WQO60291.1 hypothetical protein U8C35_07680 [Sinorhizobium medicae]
MSAGNNSKLTDAERQKLFAHMFGKLLSAELARREAAADMKAIKKLSATYDKSFTAQKFDHFLKLHFGEDDQKPVDRLKSDRENLEWAGIIAQTSKGDLLAQVDRVDGEQLIQGKGYLAGLLKAPRVSGYDAGSSDDKLWLESYDAGAAEADVGIPDILARVQAAASKEEPSPPAGIDPFSDEE